MKGVFMQTLIKPSAAIRQNYAEIANLCKVSAVPAIMAWNAHFGFWMLLKKKLVISKPLQ